MSLPRWAFGLAAVAEILFLWTLSARPAGDVGVPLPGPSGNLLHVVSNAVLACLLLGATTVRGASWRNAPCWPGLGDRRGQLVGLFILCWGVIDEAHQFFVPGRVCSVLDVSADALGGLLVLTWPGSGPGRSRRRGPPAAIFVAAVTVAVYGWLERPFPDRLLEDFLSRIAG